ncbi:MAG: cyclopropane fatty acyl phospholipid synthase [Hyphomicrobiaceae bacterium]
MNGQKIIEDLCAKGGVIINGPRPWDLKVHDKRVYDRVLSDGALGLGEAYMQGWWDADDLYGLFVRLLPQAQVAKEKNVGWRTTLAFLKARLLNVQTRGQSRKLADAHYNLSNELFEHMLGSSMAYSCGYWADAGNLDAAQFAKYDMICRKLYLKPGERLLDIGCGWGGFAKYAASEYGAEVVGITVAGEQAQYARQACKGLPVEILTCDYREFDCQENGGRFDKVASIGMIEHVGYRNYRTLLSVIRSVLREPGLLLLHTIGSNASMEVADPWMTTYIFPGGALPSMRQLGEAAEDLLVLQDLQNIGIHYTPTLRAWHDNFEAYWSNPDTSGRRPRVWGSEEVFYRMWRYYLLACAADFAVGDSQVWQLVYAKGHLTNGYIRPSDTLQSSSERHRLTAHEAFDMR